MNIYLSDGGLINELIFYLSFLSTLYFMHASAQDIVIQSTTSTRDSGLYEYLLPKYPGYSEINIKVVAVGTGQAIINAQNCDGDLLIVHDKIVNLNSWMKDME